MGIFLTNTIDRSITIMKSGRIIHVGNSGTVGVAVGVEVDVAVGKMIGNGELYICGIVEGSVVTV